jgi:hypothetical protein
MKNVIFRLMAVAALALVFAGGALPTGADAQRVRGNPAHAKLAAPLNVTPRITPPVAAAWLYMADDQAYNTIPAFWSNIDFTKVDVLFVGPVGIQADGTFGLYKSAQTGDLATRFKWVITTARRQNPKIRIIASQWWSDGSNFTDNTTIWGRPLSVLTSDADVAKYTGSAVAFVKSYLGTGGGIDGYDIDYESYNVVARAPQIVAQIKAGLAVLSKSPRSFRKFYVTVSPSDTTYLKAAAPSIDYVNMQTYEGGWDLTPQSFTALGFKPLQLLYGICPETNCATRSIGYVEQQYKQYGLAGIHLWRLNSNYVYEGQVQAQVYQFLHPAGSAPKP